MIKVGMPPIPVAVPISVVTFGNMGRYSSIELGSPECSGLTRGLIGKGATATAESWSSRTESYSTTAESTATAEVTSATTAVATATAKSSSTAATVSDPQLVGLSTSSVEPIMLSILFVFILSGSRLPHVHAIERQ